MRKDEQLQIIKIGGYLGCQLFRGGGKQVWIVQHFAVRVFTHGRYYTQPQRHVAPYHHNVWQEGDNAFFDRKPVENIKRQRQQHHHRNGVLLRKECQEIAHHGGKEHFYILMLIVLKRKNKGRAHKQQ